MESSDDQAIIEQWLGIFVGEHTQGCYRRDVGAPAAPNGEQQSLRDPRQRCRCGRRSPAALKGSYDRGPAQPVRLLGPPVTSEIRTIASDKGEHIGREAIRTRNQGSSD